MSLFNSLTKVVGELQITDNGTRGGREIIMGKNTTFYAIVRRAGW